MINFSKQSWHYKLYVKMYGNWHKMPQTICPYFWKVVWAFIFTFIITPLVIVFCFLTGIIGVSVLLSIPWLSLNLFLGFDLKNSLWGVPVYHWKALLVDLSVWGVVLGLFFLCAWIKAKRFLSPERKEPSILIEWVKAKKSKICQ